MESTVRCLRLSRSDTFPKTASCNLLLMQACGQPSSMLAPLELLARTLLLRTVWMFQKGWWS